MSDLENLTTDELLALPLGSEGLRYSKKNWITEIKRRLDEGCELQSTFDLRWRADQRAIKRWQEAHPDKKNIWPDHADLVVWLAERLEKYQIAARNILDESQRLRITGARNILRRLEDR